MLGPLKPNIKFLLMIFYNFFLFEEEHSTNNVLLSILQDTVLLKDWISTELMIYSGNPI